MGNLGLVEVGCAIVLVILGIWYYLVANFDFWKKLGVPGPKPVPFFGSFKDTTLMKKSVMEFLKETCNEFPDAPLIGIYEHRTPLLLVRDLELLKDVLIKDFPIFSERGNPVYEKVEPLGVHLFNIETKRWRSLRPKLSPAFTSGKMKHMFVLILECAEYFERYLEDLVQKNEIIDCREVTAKFTTDVIGSCAFGLQMKAIADEKNDFMTMGKKAFSIDTKARFLIILRQVAPWLYELLGDPAIPNKEVTEFFLTMMKETMDYRRQMNVERGDLVDILLQIKDSPQHLDFELTDSLMAAQAFVFFFAGFETSSATISHALYELAQQQDLQDKLREEILESLETHNGKITYDSVKEMKYLHMVFQETLRLRPPIGIQIRKSVKEYTFKNTNVTIPAGQRLWIPVLEIHTNPEYYPNPEVFDPERFTEEMCKARNPMTYLPFGDGPRNCIGARFAIYQSKLGLIKILSNFKVEVCAKTCIPYKPSIRSIILQPDGGIHLKFSKIQ